MLSSTILRGATRVSVRRAATSGNGRLSGVRRQSTIGAGGASKGGPLTQWYNIFGNSNAGYVMWIVGGVLVGEFLTGTATDVLWNSVNAGKTYESVDWSKFVVEDDDDDEDDDDEEEEDEEGDDDDEDDED